MKFATIGHLMVKKDIEQIPKKWIHNDWIYSPELDLNGTKGRITGLKLTAEQIITQPLETIRNEILDLALFVQNELNVDLIQLGALTTSVTSGGRWLVDQCEYTGYVNHGDSYTSAVTCQTVFKSLKMFNKNPPDATLAVIGAYGIIGEAVSKILVPQFKHSILIGRRKSKLEALEGTLKGNFETTIQLKTENADVIVTATSHPTALLNSDHLKKNAVVVDVSQPPNLAYNVCQQRPDISRIDGGFVDFPKHYPFQVPGIPIGKMFSCVAEVLMQAMENEHQNHAGSIDMEHLKKTEEWGKKYKFTLNELTNFGNKI
jgi:predicted amino acid dehydrogenase